MQDFAPNSPVIPDDEIPDKDLHDPWLAFLKKPGTFTYWQQQASSGLFLGLKP